MTASLKVRLVGVLSLQDETGRDCTPRGAKARGIISLLALAPEHRRTRRWIEAKLWSDRAPEQASGSLRQALMELRTALGDASACLQSDREFVAFAGLETDLGADPDASRVRLAAGAELLEGIDVRDPAYDDWLRDQRTHFQPDSLHAPPPTTTLSEDHPGIPLLIRTGQMPSGFGGFATLAMADAIGGLVSEFATVNVYGTSGATVQLGPQERGLLMQIDASEADDQLHVMCVLGATRTGQSLWSRRVSLPLKQRDLLAQGEFPTIVFEAAEAALASLPRVVGTETALLKVESLVARAVREMFSFDVHRLRLADSLLAEAARLMPGARIYAWQSLLRQIMLMERTEPNRAELLAEASTFSRKAMDGPWINPLVLALVSQVQVTLLGDVEKGKALAHDALARSPYNAFGHAASAIIHLREGRPEQALSTAQQGARLAQSSSFLHWWESLAGMAYIGLGQYDDAIAVYESARARAPSFRPPLRNLLFLYLKRGDHDKAQRTLVELQQLEPDFTLDRARNDPDYPAETMRRANFLKLEFPD
jgi:tetratricopeptide (TPR) repeat protein